MPLSRFHPLISRWFQERFGEPTRPQLLGWPSVLSGRDTLIAAPTGSGKTLAAFLACIDRLFREAASGGGLPDETRVLYISPLRALSNDIRRNLEVPLQEIQAAALHAGIKAAPIRAELRTGDTPASGRQALLKRPPHILVTTPESFFLLLTASKGRRLLSTVRTVIVDEIHAVARDKRGSHLSLSLERLAALCPSRPMRIGLSATQRPMDEIARFLVGTNRVDAEGAPRCAVVDVGHERELDLAVEVPAGPLSAVCSKEQWQEVYNRLAELIRQHHSTLVFVNTRRLAERVTHHLVEHLGPDAVSSHHGSLSKKVRLAAEQRLKAGELKAVVATASLELGIDIGFVDLVVQMGSPRAISTFLQRIGRSGHALGKVPKGRLFALTRDELLECAALLRAVGEKRLDRIEIPRAPLDILAQQMVAEAACRELSEDELFNLCRGAWPYRDLSFQVFYDVLRMLAAGPADGGGDRARGAYLHHDRVGRRIRSRRSARLAALTSGGAIPELADYRVVAHPEQVTVGSVDEDFAVESLAGDVFLLGNTSWRILHVRGGEVTVADAHGAPPTIPFWRGEAPSRTLELSAEISRLRQDLADRAEDPEAAVAWLMQQVPLGGAAARQAVDYVRAQLAALGVLPTQEHLVFERFFDEAGGMQLVIHSPFGGRINRAWGLALRKRFCRTFNFELQASADDNGIVISLGPQQGFPLEQVREMLPSAQAEGILVQALLAAPLFMTRWRWNANRALAVLRWRGGKRVPPPLQRMRADDLLVGVFPQQMACRENLPQGDIPVPDHPLVAQTVDDCLHEAMDLDGWLGLLRALEKGEVRAAFVDSREPSPFSYEILNANPYAFLDDAPLEERRARAVASRRALTVESVRDIGKLDPQAVERVRKEAWPLVRDVDELHDALALMVLLPEGEGSAWSAFFEVLLAQGRAVRAVDAAGEAFWACAESWPLVRTGRPDLNISHEPVLPEDVRRDWSAAEAWVAFVRGRLEVSGPATAQALSQYLRLSPGQTEAALSALEAQGAVLRGRFTPQAEETEWCARHLLTRIHRLTLDRLRRQIQPVPPEQYLQFLFRWQHAEAGSRLYGPEALAAVVEQLQGFEVPALAWEPLILPLRLIKYDPQWLDALCLSGEVAWGRLGLPVIKEEGGGQVRTASKVLPLSLMLREDLPWLRAGGRQRREGVERFLGHGARSALEALRQQGASFFSDLLSATALLPAQLEEALWELVAAGLITGDGYSAVRALTDPLRRQREAAVRRARRRGRPAYAVRRTAGRWTLLPAFDPPLPEEVVEAWARQLLHRYGIFFRNLLAREDRAPAWGDLRAVLARMEARGEVYGGRFVSEAGGEQYGLPEAVQALRKLREENPEPKPLFLSAADPLNLVGVLSPQPRVPAQAAHRVAFYGGRCAGFARGEDIWIAQDLDPQTAQSVRQTLASGRLPQTVTA